MLITRDFKFEIKLKSLTNPNLDVDGKPKKNQNRCSINCLVFYRFSLCNFCIKGNLKKNDPFKVQFAIRCYPWC